MTTTENSRRKINWALIWGLILVSLMTFLALIGPLIAPHDPMQQNYALESNGRIHSPPYDPFEVKGYPLGTDDFGRDMLSRILWGMRPTLMMVVVVAGVRLLLALVIGMVAGWSTGVKERGLESLISGAISLPVLIVAVISISAIGIEHGLWVFILGLALNGWAETAHLVSEKTREVKNQTYVEVSRALGAKDGQIMVAHVLPQILPMIWMLISHEISSTLLVAAELGFLGYYVGGGTWIELTDFNAVRTSGLPELGQILATSIKNLTRPTVLVVTGSVIVLMILGFNLLGDGVRVEMAETRIQRRKTNALLGRVTEWFGWTALPVVETWFKRRVVWVSGIVLLIMIIGGSIGWNMRPRSLQLNSENGGIPGAQNWAMERGDAQGTRLAKFKGPSENTILWQKKIAGNINGGPVVAESGMVFVIGLPDTLFAFDSQGNLVWQAALDTTPVGTPAVGAGGQVYIVNRDGGLSAFASDGTLLWKYSSPGRIGTSGPVVARDGNIYYTRMDRIQAVSPTGEGLWNNIVSDTVLDIPPRLSPKEDLLLIKTALVLTENGAPVNTDTFTKLDPTNFYTDPFFFIGANDAFYFRVGHGVLRWDFVVNRPLIGEQISWDPRNPQLTYPYDAGVDGQGLIWLIYTGRVPGLGAVVWLDEKTKTKYGEYRNTFSIQTSFIGVDLEEVSYICGYTGTAHCLGIKPGIDKPVWEIQLPAGEARNDVVEAQIWGALAPGRLYVTTQDGYLFALGNGIENIP